MPEDAKNAGIDRPPSFWGDNPRLRNTILVAVGLLILGRAVTTLWVLEDNWRAVAEWMGVPVVPAVDPSKANARLKPPDLQDIFGSPANYPEDARDRGEQGSVAARLRIAPNGTVQGCAIDGAEASPALNAATCRIAFDRARFEPARDGDGRPVSSTFMLRVRWQLPD